VHVLRFYKSGALFSAVLVLPCGTIFRPVSFILLVHDSCELIWKSPSSEESLSCSSSSLKIVDFVVILVDVHYKDAEALWIELTCHVYGMCERVWLVLRTGEEIKVSLIVVIDVVSIANGLPIRSCHDRSG
jgi:hypothetical protein